MPLLGFSSLFFFLFSFFAFQAHSITNDTVNISTDVNPTAPGFVWALPSTATIIGLYREAYGLPLNPSALKLCMLLARFALQRAEQDAGGQHLPLIKDFEYDAQGFTVAVRQAGPGVPSIGKLLYSDVENMFTAIEQQLNRLEYVEANIQILRLKTGPKEFLGFGMIGRSKSGNFVGDQSTALNQTVTAIEQQLSIEVAPPAPANDTLIELNAGGDGSTQPDVTSQVYHKSRVIAK